MKTSSKILLVTVLLSLAAIIALWIVFGSATKKKPLTGASLGADTCHSYALRRPYSSCGPARG